MHEATHLASRSPQGSVHRATPHFCGVRLLQSLCLRAVDGRIYRPMMVGSQCFCELQLLMAHPLFLIRPWRLQYTSMMAICTIERVLTPTLHCPFHHQCCMHHAAMIMLNAERLGKHCVPGACVDHCRLHSLCRDAWDGMHLPPRCVGRASQRHLHCMRRTACGLEPDPVTAAFTYMCLSACLHAFHAIRHRGLHIHVPIMPSMLMHACTPAQH